MRLVRRTSVRRALFALVLFPLLGGVVSVGILVWLTTTEADDSRAEAAEVRTFADINLAFIDTSSELALMQAWASSPEARVGEAGFVFTSWIDDQSRLTDEGWARLEPELGRLDPIVRTGLRTAQLGVLEVRRLYDEGRVEQLGPDLVELRTELDGLVGQLHTWTLQDGGLDRIPLVEITELGGALGDEGALLAEVALVGGDAARIAELAAAGSRVELSFERVAQVLDGDLRSRFVALGSSEASAAYRSLADFVVDGGRLDSSQSATVELLRDLELIGVFYEELGAITSDVFDRSAADADRAAAAAVDRRNLVVGAGVVALGSLAAMAAAIARTLGRRIDAVADVAHKIAGGELSVDPIDLPGDDEIAELAGAMDDMVATLRIANDQLGALAAGRTDDPALEVDLPGSIGRNLRSAIDRLGSSTAELKRQATHDALTELLDRYGLDLVIEQLDGVRSEPIGVIVLDLDGFKHVNDDLGHAAGDELLRVVAERLTAEAREGDVVARVGGDEFVLLVPAVDPEQVEQIAGRLVAAACRPVTVDGEPLHVGASAGWVVADPSTPIGLAIDRADVAMFDAKRAGRGRAVGGSIV